jgi:2-octaprenyl-6-methoxyphenol hydroxylase
MAGAPALRNLRAAALRTLYGAAPVRKVLMQAGLGARPSQAGNSASTAG